MGQAELYYKSWIYFRVIQSLGILLFLAGITYNISFYFKGRKKSLYKKCDYVMMFQAFCRYVVFQKQLAEKSIVRWLIHILIFYGFLGLLLLSGIAVLLEVVVPGGSALSRYMVSGQGYNYYKATGDLFGLVITIGLILAVFRRYIFQDSRLYTESTDTAILVFLLTLVGTGFLLEGLRINLALRMALPGSVQSLRYSFIGYRLAGLFDGIRDAGGWAVVLWTVHSTLNVALLAYIPHSKFLHIVSSPLEIILNASEERMRGDLYL